MLKKFGYDLDLIKQQQICEGQGGYIDLYCKDKSNNNLIVVELKIVRAKRKLLDKYQNIWDGLKRIAGESQ